MSATATAAPAVAHDRSMLVRWVRVDAAISGLLGAAMLIWAPLLDGPLGVSTDVLLALGAFLLAYAAALVWIVRMGVPTRWAQAVIAGNVAWAALGVVAVLAHWLTPTTAGAVVALAQAAATAILAELQYVGLRRAR